MFVTKAELRIGSEQLIHAGDTILITKSSNEINEVMSQRANWRSETKISSARTKAMQIIGMSRLGLKTLAW